MKLAFTFSLSLNVVLYVRYLLLKWHLFSEIRSAQIVGRREGWSAAMERTFGTDISTN